MRKLGLVAGLLGAVLLSACGGGGGGSGGSSASVAASPSGSSLYASGLSCSGGTCALSDGAAASPSGSVLYLANLSATSQTVTLPAAPSAGNWQGVVSSIDNPGGGGSSLAAGGAYRTDGGGEGAEQRLQAIEQQLQALPPEPAQGSVAGIQLRSAVYNKAYNLGDSDSWYDHANSVAVTATVLGKVPLNSANPSGPQLYVWADSSQSSKVTPAMVSFLTSNFLQYIAPLETQLIGAPWGTTASRFGSSILLPGSTADVHLVLASLNRPASVSGLQGFVNTVNVYRKSYATTYNSQAGCASSANCQATVAALSNSNEALVTFLNLDTLVYTGGGTWTDNAPGAKQLFFTLAHEYQHLLYSYNKLFSPTSVANTFPTTWENELASQTIAYLVAAALYPDPKGGAREHPELVNGGEFEQFLKQPSCDLKSWGNGSACYYPKAVVTGMLMLHQFGPGVFKQWVTTPTVGEAALNLGLASVGGVNYSRVMQRLGASLAMTNTTSYPAGYGFPARSYTVAGITINLPAVQIPSAILRLASGGETYAQALDFSNTVTVTLPAYSYLSLVKQP